MHPPNARGQGPTVAERYRALLDIARRLAGTLATNELYEAIYVETASLLEAVGFYISLYDADRDQARIVFFVDRGQIRRDVDVVYPGSRSDVLRTKRGVLVEDRLAERSLTFLGDEESAPTTSGISAPIVYKGRLMGAVSAQSYEPNTYTQEDLAMLECIADLAGVALDNARVVAELEARRTEAEQVEEIGRAMAASLDASDVLGRVIGAVVSVLDVDGASVWVIDRPGDPVAKVAESGGEIRLPPGACWDLSGELADRLIRREEPVVLDDLADSPLVPDTLREQLSGGSGMGAPLVVGGRVAGVLAAGSRRARRFGAIDVGILQRLAAQASVALENARLHSNVQALSLTDALTGLPNRRRLQIHLEKEVAAARRGRDLVVVVFDLNNFKHFNDTLGHVVGDDILRAFAGILHQENRAMNLVARYGGDEFVCVLSDTDPDGALGFVERVTRRMDADPILSQHGVTASIGLGAFDRTTMKTGEDALHAADADMYRSKGRDVAATRPLG